MKFTELIGQKLIWHQPHAMNMEYELQAANEVVATLHFRSSFGTFATAKCAEGKWTFKRVGFWHPRVTIRAYGSDTNLAVFIDNTWSGGGTLEMPDGRKFPANTNFWATQYEFQTESGEPLVSYKKIGGWLHLSSATEIHPVAKATIAELPWIVMLGWYLSVMMNMDASGVVVTAMG